MGWNLDHIIQSKNVGVNIKTKFWTKFRLRRGVKFH